MQTKQEKIRKIYGICLIALTALLCVGFAVQALLLYLGGGYTQEGVERLTQMLLPVCLWAAAVIAGVAVYALFPAAEKKPKVGKNLSKQLASLSARLPEEAWANGKKRFRRKSIILWSICGGVCGVLFFFPICYLLNGENFNYTDTNTEMINAAIHTFPFVGVAFAVVVVAYLLQQSFLRVALDEVKKLMVEAAKAGTLCIVLTGGEPLLQGAAVKETWLDNPKALWIVRGVLFAGALFLLVFGIANGGLNEVFKKAAELCTECVGLA